MTGSMRSSPTQNRPQSTARNTPVPTPSSSPIATRWSEMSRLDWSTPWLASSRAASNTATGEATSTLVNSPRRADQLPQPDRRERADGAPGQPWHPRDGEPPAPGARRADERERARAGGGARRQDGSWRAGAVHERSGAGPPVRPRRRGQPFCGTSFRTASYRADCGRAVQRGHAVGLGEGPAAGHQIDHLLQRALHSGVDGHVGEGAAGGEDQLRHLPGSGARR